MLVLPVVDVTGGGATETARAAAPPTTVTGTRSGDHAWDPKHNRQYRKAPSVTVDQTHDLTDQVVHVTWKNFTPSDDPAGNFFSGGNTYYAVTVLECRGVNPRPPTSWTWPDFGPDCYNFTPDNANAAHGVGNQAYTLTGANGQGEAYFHVETSVENDFLRCSARQPCSVVVVPNWGGMQEPGYKPGSSGVNCDDHSGDNLLIFGNYALDTRLGAACSWGDRVVVPLHFAPTPQNCPARHFEFAAEGAPMLARTLDQWRAGWCTGSSHLYFDFDSGTNEDLARQSFLSGSGALTSAIDVAVVNKPAPSGSQQQRKFAYAPLANSAITVAYHIDNQRTGKLITNLTLDARLVAKLVTQSYSLAFDCSVGGKTGKQGPTCDPAVKGNPVSIFDDPEFKKLNPRLPRADFPSDSLLNRGQFLPLVVSGTSDLVYELTRWIDSDPRARAFMNGKPDPWGMHINRYYKHEPLPTTQFQILDPGYTAPASNGVPGISTMQVTWNPISGMANVASSLVTDRPSGINPTLPPCGVSGVPCVYQRFGSAPPGNRALFAIVGLVDAAADRFPTAKLVNAAGRAVAPTNASLRAALSEMTTNRDGVTQSANFRSKNARQYPLTTVDYAMVPTCGLTTAKATAISQLLDLAARSQHTGLLPGQLAPGDLPLTARQVTQAHTASDAVSTTSCKQSKPPEGTGHSTTPSSAPPASTPTVSSSFTPPPPSGSVPGGAPVPIGTPTTPTASDTLSASATVTSSSNSSSASSPAAAPSSLASSPSPSPAAYGIKHADSGGPGRMFLPVLLVLVTAVLIGGSGGYALLGSGIPSRWFGRMRRGGHR